MGSHLCTRARLLLPITDKCVYKIGKNIGTDFICQSVHLTQNIGKFSDEYSNGRKPDTSTIL